MKKRRRERRRLKIDVEWEKLQRENRLARELGITDGGEWHSQKRGGPVHYWTRITVMPGEYAMYTSKCGRGEFLKDLGKLRDYRSVKATCKRCRAKLISEHHDGRVSGGRS